MVPPLPPAKRICENRAAPASSAFGRGGEGTVGGCADIAGSGRAATAERVEEIGGVDAVFGLGGPWRGSGSVVREFAALLVIGLLR